MSGSYPAVIFKGDEIKLKTGETAEVLDTWGIARTWYKLKTNDGRISFAIAENIESILRRHKGWRIK